MKKIFAILIAFVSIVACNNSGEKKEDKPKDNQATESTSDITTLPEYQKGFNLVGKADCFTCHKVDGELAGPGFKQIAQKYQGADDTKIAALSQSIIKGSKGTWGEKAMTPHAYLSEEDVKAMVKYILLLK